MVRLKDNGVLDVVYAILFQFHYGSIKGRLDFVQRFNFCSFNSTMVRLKVIIIYKDNNRIMFQFHYGSIKGRVAYGVLSPYQCFNSTMVRLKVLFNPFNPKSFHVSIPLWFD